MKKLVTAAIALSAAAVMLTGCSRGNKAANDTQTQTQSQTTTSQSQTTTHSESVTESHTVTSHTGDVDGDGLIEELGTDVNDIVSDVVTGAEDIAGDILHGGENNTDNNNNTRTVR